MNTISTSILLLPLTLLLPIGCASEPSTASELAAVTAQPPSSGDRGISDEQLAARARIAASGLYTVPVTADFTPALATTWGDALDIPEELVVAATVTGSPGAADVFDDGDLGVVRSSQGGSFVLLSTGIAGANAPAAGVGTAEKPEPGTDFLPTGTVGDTVTLSLVVKVPEGANRMSLQYNFLSAESPDFVGSQFNDTFSVQIIEGADVRTFPLASVNSSEFFSASSSRAKGSGFDIYAADPSDVDIVGDVGLPDAGLTGMQSFNASVTSGAELTIVFTVGDLGDGILDSAVLLDALQFSAIETLDPNPDLVVAGGGLTPDVELLATGGDHVRGAVADGVTEILLRVKTPGPGSVAFALFGAGLPADGGLRTLTGSALLANVQSRTVPAAGGHFAFAVYRAPVDFSRGPADEPLAERSIEINAAFTPDSAPNAVPGTRIELQLRRPPVVLAQGLWAKSQDWLALALTNDARFMITFVDRAYRCDTELRAKIPDGQLLATCPLEVVGAGEGLPLCLADRTDPISAATREAIAKVRRLGVAATKVDLVAHGAGGIHARKYINSNDYKDRANREQGDVNRLITLNTPHFGSPVADAIVALREALADDDEIEDDDVKQYLCSARISGSTPVDAGDIDELTTAASALDATTVPSHAFFGAGGKGLSPRNVKAKLLNRAILYSKLPALTTMFGALDHDLFSSIDSQQGGIAAGARSVLQLKNQAPPADLDTYFEFDAFLSLRHPEMSVKLVGLLNSPIPPAGQPSLFGTFAKSPAPALAAAAPPPAIPPALLPPDAAVRIIAPADGTDVIAGSTITVEVIAENGFVPDAVAVTTGRLIAFSEAAPFTMTIAIPADALGPIRLLALGFGPDDEGAVHDEVVLIAKTTATLEAVKIVTQDPSLFGLGKTRQLAVVGQYNDGVTRDITESFVGTVYRSSNNGIVRVSSNGIVTAVGAGIATVVAQNGSVQDSITVTVSANSSPLAAANGEVSLTCVAPGASVPVQLDGSASFDPDGDPVELSWLENGVVVASGPTPTIALAPGVHAIELEVSDGNGGIASAVVNVTILEDTEPPSVAIAGADPRTVECGTPFTDDGATATDVCDGDLTAAIVAQSNVDPGEPGTYTVEYRVTDQAGLTSTAVRSVSVQDTQAPQLTILGASPRTVECAGPFVDDGATAIDACDGDLTAAIVAQSNVDPSVPGSYAVDYRVNDRAGATSVASRIVLVDDDAPPEITVKPMTQLAPANLRYEEFTLADCAQAIDACEGVTDIDQSGRIVAIHSDEPDSIVFFDPDDDIVILGNSRFQLRRQNRLFRNGRVYEIEFVVDDAGGNTSATRSCFIGVKTSRNSPAPINDGRVFTVLP